MSQISKDNLEVETRITQFGTSKEYLLKPISLIHESPDRFREICESCSQDQIYKWLFTKRFPEGYGLENAKEFFLWAQDGWKYGTHFVYLLTTQAGEIVGSIDIRSNKDLAESGYWVNSNHAGLATNALSKVAQLASNAGYKTLFAQVESKNTRSIKVLERNGFIRDDKFKVNENCDYAYKKML